MSEVEPILYSGDHDDVICKVIEREGENITIQVVERNHKHYRYGETIFLPAASEKLTSL